MESAHEDPPEKVWEGIQDELDVDLVWGGLSKRLGTRRALLGHKNLIYTSIAASMLLLVVAAGLFYYLSVNNVSRDYIADITHVSPTTAERLQSLPAERSAITTTTGYATHLDKRTAYSGMHFREHGTGGFQSEDRQYYRIVALPPENSLQPTDIPYAVSGLDIYLRPADMTTDYQEITGESTEETPTPRFFAGLSAQFANTWMMNNKTLSGLQTSSLTDTRLSFGKSFGLTGGVTLSEKTELQMNLDILSQKRQGYNEYIHGRYVSTSLDMDYTKLSLTVHYRPLKHLPHRVVGGGYLGYLMDASSKVNGNSESIRDMYSSLDYGVTGGYEYLHNLGNNIQLGTGLYANYGLRNVFAGDEYIPSYLGRTHHLSFHLGISVRYGFY